MLDVDHGLLDRLNELEPLHHNWEPPPAEGGDGHFLRLPQIVLGVDEPNVVKLV